MYMLKSEVIGQIQSYHRQLADLYLGLYEKVHDKRIGMLIHDLQQHELARDHYLEKHKKIAEANNCWLSVPAEKLSNQISACFKDIHTGPGLTMSELINIELHFDNCLIKLYNILSVEDELSESMHNIFYYMLKKTKKEEATLARMLVHSKDGVNYKFSIQNN